MSGKLWSLTPNKDVLCAECPCVTQDEMFYTSEQEVEPKKHIYSLSLLQNWAHQVILESVMDNGDVQVGPD